MHLAPARRSELGQRIAQAQQDEIAAQRGVDAEVMVLHLQRQQVAAQRRRHAAEEVGYGRGWRTRFRYGRDARPLGIGLGMQALLDEQAEQDRDDHRQERRLGKDLDEGAQTGSAVSAMNRGG